jgi:hypothetical protein
MKTIKIYIKNSLECKGTHIYCVKCEKSEELCDLKQKIFMRFVNIMKFNIIYDSTFFFYTDHLI